MPAAVPSSSEPVAGLEAFVQFDPNEAMRSPSSGARTAASSSTDEQRFRSRRASEGGGDVLHGDVYVVCVDLTLGQRDLARFERLVGHLAEQVGDDVEPRPLLVVGG